MKNVIKDLTSLLILSSENKDEAKKLNLLVDITFSSEYSALSHTASIVNIYKKLFSIANLDIVGNNELEYRKSLLHKITSFYENLKKSIHFGNAPILTAHDLPDYTSLESITNTFNKITLSPHMTNYSNIQEDDPAVIFSDTTIKNAEECVKRLPISVIEADVINENTICNNIGDNTFCVDSEEFKQAQASVLERIRTAEERIKREKDWKRKHWLLKISIVMLCWGLFYTCSSFNLFSSDYQLSFALVMFFTTILALIWG